MYSDSFGGFNVMDAWEGPQDKERLLTQEEFNEFRGYESIDEFRENIDGILAAPAMRIYLNPPDDHFKDRLHPATRTEANARVIKHKRIIFFVAELVEAMEASLVPEPERRHLRVHLNQLARDLFIGLKLGEPDDFVGPIKIVPQLPMAKSARVGDADLPDLVGLGGSTARGATFI